MEVEATRADQAPAAETAGGGLDTLGVARILAAIFLYYTAMGAVIPVLQRYIPGPLGAGTVAVSIIIGFAGGVTALLVRPFAGYYAEVRGSRSIVLLGAALGTLAGLLYLVPAGLAGLFAARLLLGAGEGLLFTAGLVWVVRIAPPDRRGQLIGFPGLAIWSGLTLGPIVGEAILNAWGYRVAWGFAALAPLVAGLLGAGVHDLKPASAERRRVVVLPRAAIQPGIAMGLGAVGYAALGSFVVLFGKNRGIAHPVLVLSAEAGTYVLVRAFLGRLPDRFGPRRVALLSGVGEALGLLLIAGSHSLWQAVLGGLVMGAGFSLLYPSLALMVVRRSRPGEQGLAVGAYTSFWDAGLLVSGLTLGLVVSAAGYTTLFVVGAGCALAAAILGLLAPDRP